MPIFDALKPEGEFGFVHAGKVGAGHFAKMVHNGIEYGLMQAYAEGYELLAANDIVTDVAGAFSGLARRHGDPLLAARPAGARRSRRTRAWRRSAATPQDSGEGRWTVEEAIDHAVPMPVISRGAVRPVRLPPGRLARDEGRRRAAQPVRRARGHRLGHRSDDTQAHPAP